MIVFIGNGLGCLAILVYFAVFLVLGTGLVGVFGPTREVQLLVTCLAASTCALLDLWCRGLIAKDPLAYFHPRKGGSLFYIPVWVIGLGIVFATVSHSMHPTLGRPVPARKAPQQAPGPRSQPANSPGSSEGQSSPRKGAVCLPRGTFHVAMLPASAQAGRRHLTAPLPSA
jgi:hypothetical protein